MMFLINPLHYALHHHLRWRLADNYSFALDQTSVAIGRSEIRAMASHAPLAIQRISGRLHAVAILDPAWSAQPPLLADGRWRTGKAPLALRVHPFRTIDDGREPGRRLLGVAADPDWVREDKGEPFFDHLAQMLPGLEAMHQRLQRQDHQINLLSDAAETLASAGLLQSLERVPGKRTPFLTVDADAVAALSAGRLASLGPRPQDALALALALHHSVMVQRNERMASEPGAASLAAPQKATPAFLIDDDLVMTFET